MIRRFLEQAEKSSQKTALRDPASGQERTYGELNASARALCAKLKAEGFGIGDAAMITASRGIGFVEAILGVLMAGGIYVPLSSHYPRERLNFIREDSGAKLVLDDAWITEARKCDPLTEIADSAPSDPALIAYTSGSTGRPKGILHDHQSLTDALDRFFSFSRLQSEDVYAINGPFYFIVHIVDVFGPLTTGMTACIVPEPLRGDPEGLADFIDLQGVTGVFIPPKVLRFFHKKGSSLRFVLTGSERLAGIAPDGFRLVNAYGMTETAGIVTAMDVDHAWENTPLGRSLENTHLYLLDEEGNPCDEGEICISGHFARGYLNLPEHTSEVFTPNPFRDQDGCDTLLHTGDLGRMENGNLLYVNRRDWMLKINGQRVEPGEIEAGIRALPGIKDAAVRDFTDAFGDVYLSAYYLSDAERSEAEFRNLLSLHFPAYMIPAYYVRLDRFPVNANGKLDRFALPDPRMRDEQGGDVRFENEGQKIIFKALAAIVGHGRYDLSTPFEEAGLNSIGSIRMTQALSDAFGVPVSLSDLHAHPNIRDLEACLSARTPSENEERRITYPLTRTQMGILAECLSEPDSTEYNIPLLLKLSPRVDIPSLRHAVEQALSAHPFLFTRLAPDAEGHWMAKRQDEESPLVEIVEADALPDDLLRPFHLLNEALYRVRIFVTPSGNYLFMDIHHILADGTSMVILTQDINAACAGKEPERETYTGFEAALEEERRRGTERLDEDRAYYRELLSGADVLSLPTGDRSAEKTSGRIHLESALDISAIREFCQQNHVTENAFFNAVFAFVLSRFTFSEDVLYTTIFSGRNDSRLSRSTAMLVRTLPVSLHVRGSLAVVDLIRETGRQLMASMSHDLYSFAEISQEFDLRSDLMLAYQGDTFRFDRIGGESAQQIPLSIQAQRPLSMDIFVRGLRTDFEMEFDAGRYSHAFMRALADCVEKTASEFLEKTYVRDVSMVSDAALSDLRRFNDTDEPVDMKGVHHLFEDMVRQHPDQTALIAAGTRLTYAQLDEMANRIADALTRRGLKMGETVGMLLPRTVHAVAAEYGILKAGGAFLPMLPDYPRDRVDYCMTDSGSRFLITAESVNLELSSKAYPVLTVEDLLREGEPVTPPLSVSPGQTAYCIYTSGSTGRPKGVKITHGNLCNFLTTGEKNEECRHYVSYGRVALAIASLSFDYSLMEIHLPLCHGLTLCLATEEEIQNPLLLARLMEENQVDIMAATPSFMSGLMEIPEAVRAMRGLKMVDLGAEAFPPALFGKVRQASPEAVIVNGYGPTETTIGCISKRMESAENITIGRPAANVKAWVCDPCGNILPPLVKGELVIGGLGVGEGYVNLPEKTAEVFITLEGGRAYRTGDIVRLNHDLELEFFGRQDNQIKLRGLRIELDEIENVMNTFPDITRSVVLLQKPAEGDAFLCGYFTARTRVDTADLKAHLAGRLARYMIPAAFLQLEAFPMTASGKVDRKALPMPERAEENFTPPENETQKRIFDLAASVMGHTSFGVDSDLYESGLSSLGAIRLNVLLSRAFDRPLSIRDLRDHPTVSGLAGILCADSAQETIEILPDYPLSRTQTGILAETLAHPDTVIYNTPSLIRLPEEVEVDRLQRALEMTLQAHPCLNASLYASDSGEYRFRRQDDAAPVVEILHVPQLPEPLVKPFDLLRDRLYRARIYITPEDRYLFLEFHHIVYDGTSDAIFMEDLNRAYEGQVPEKETYTGFEAALEEEKLLKTEAFTRAKTYFDTLLGSADFDMLPDGDILRADAAVSSAVLDRPSGLSPEKIRDFCRDTGVTENAFFNAAFAFVLSRFCGRKEALYTTVYNGRNDSRLERAVTMLVRTFPVLLTLDGEQAVADLVRDAGRQLSQSMSHDLYAFSEIARDYHISPDVLFVWQGRADEEVEIGGYGARLIPLELDEAKAPLQLEVFETGGAYRYHCEYHAGRFSESFIRAFTDCLDQAASEMLFRSRLMDVLLMTPESQAHMDSLNRTDMPCPLTDIVSLFRRAALENPGEPAVIFRDEVLTYAQTDELSDRIAAFLRDRGIGREKVVSVLISRSSFMATASLGVLKAGAAYQPLDPSYPGERLNFMVRDAGCSLLIAEESLLDRVSEYQGPVLLTRDIPGLPQAPALPDHPAPEDALILLYSSGTTGQPKGVILEHHNLVNFCTWYRQFYHLTPRSRVAAYASYGFDACMMDLYPALTTGAAVVIIPEEERLDFDAILRRFEKEHVTHCFMTTQVGRQFAEFCTGGELQYLSVGGEKLAPFHVDRPFAFYNAYGPTECTIFTTAFEVDRLYTRVPIGRPLGNYRLYVADEHLHRLPPFVPGELVVAGNGVGRGYLNRPELTAKAFIPNPFSRDEGYSHAYRTGDIVRLLPDGTIDFIGRNDGQVKIRGFRIETTEVEAVIREFPGVRDATVQAFDNPDGSGKYLCAYVVSAGDTLDIQALNAFILSRKPPYMVPAVTMTIDAIPLNQNQKVNRKALPVPEMKARKEENAPAAPLNVLEEEIRSIAAEILGTGDFGITDLFGNLGLTSITGIRLAAKILRRFGVQTNARELVSAGSIQSVENEILTSLLNRKAEGGEEPEKTAEKPQSCRLTFSQQGVYAECQAHPDTVRYNVPFALTFPEGTTTEQLDAALRKVVHAHPSILCRFVPDREGEIIQEQIPDFRLEIPVLDLSPEETEAHILQFPRPFDLAAGPACRFEILNASRPTLLLDMHHLVSDGASMDLFLDQLCQALDGAEPEKESYSCYDYAAEERILPETEAFFADRMAEMEDATQLLPDVYEDRPHREEQVSAPTDIAAVKAFARKLGITPSAVYLAAAFLTFGRYVCEDTVAIATISNGRSNLKISNTMGMFVNTLPLVTQLRHEEPVRDYLLRIARLFSDTIANEHYPFARIASKYDFHPALSLTYQIGVLNTYRTKAGEVETRSLELDLPKLPAGVYIEGTEESAVIRVAYDGALYSQAMMRGLAESVENAVRGLMTRETLSDISITGEETWKKLDAFNAPWDLDYDRNDTVVTAFRRNAKAHPDKVAAVFRDRTYTYRELDELTDRLAAKLYRRSCEVTGRTDLAEQVVSILISRNENVFILPLAAIKAGLAYEPLDPGYPAERLNFMVRDANACLLLAQADLAERLDAYTGPVLTVEELYAMEDVPLTCPGPAPEDLFIMLYTSGSTGTPKGCQIEHRNLVAFAHGIRHSFCTENDRTGAYASFGFDVNMEDVFCTLVNGGTVCLIPEEIRMDLGALAAYFDQAGVTALLLTTQVGVQFIQNYPQLKTLRLLIMGGEKLPAVDPSRLSYTIANGYGPTENCCGVSLFPIRTWEPNVPIGKPLATIHGYILDKTGHRLPAGAAGEYCLSGPQVTRGYLNRPDKTAEAYGPCPFNEFRMYHTGDIVRYRENGDVEFVGRRDGQVKIRGFRVETKEVETVIRGFEGIEDVTVQACDYEGGGKYLAAYVVSPAPVDMNRLRAFIREQKPAYMVPAAIMQIEKIPLTVNQKVDRKALPAPNLQKAAYRAPEGREEEDFCAIFGSILGIDRVSAETDFFEAGGSSILAMKVVIAAEKAGYSLVYNDVFKYTTPRDLARFVGASPAETSPAPESEESSVLPETGRDGYDYSRIHALLAGNTLEAFLKGACQPLGDVLLLGGTGYLGSHVLRELVLHGEGRLFCLVRSGRGESGGERLRNALRKYFGDDFLPLMDQRVTVLEGDATDASALTAFKAPSPGMTVINCAASVKHFAKGNEIERANVDSVRNLAAWCEANEARLVHISTGSVIGSRSGSLPPANYRLDEHRLYAGQEIDNNQYVHSKFMAERHIYEEILDHGLRAKVLRVGNLAPREEDGEFQLNYTTNNHMNSLRALAILGVIGYDALNAPMEYSPIDCVAKAVLALATTPEACVCFMPMNPHRPLMQDVIREINGVGHPIRGAENEEFSRALQEALGDDRKNASVGCLIAYESNDDSQEIGLEGIDHTYTVGILERLSFTWPETGSAYIHRFLDRLEQKDFFGRNESC